MSNFQKDGHLKLIKDWENTNAIGLNSDQHLQLLEKAIRAIELRAGSTLSVVTLTLILDRVLHETKDKYPLLSEALFESNRLSFEKMHIHHKSFLPNMIRGKLHIFLVHHHRKVSFILTHQPKFHSSRTFGVHTSQNLPQK